MIREGYAGHLGPQSRFKILAELVNIQEHHQQGGQEQPHQNQQVDGSTFPDAKRVRSVHSGRILPEEDE